MIFRVGHGYDVHRLLVGRELWLGGVKVPFEKGLMGHSDADVLLHAICDALLGAMAEGDIGKHFPDTDKHYKDIDSKILLQKVRELMISRGWELGNLDATLILEAPKIAPYIAEIRKTIAGILNVDPGQVSLKATTTEGLGSEGRGEGISAHAVCLIHKS